MHPIQTPYAKTFSHTKPLQEYPRPQMVRDSYMNLNGLWKYSICLNQELPVHWVGDILVPFSPESSLSGVRKTITPEDVLWYKREVTLAPGFLNKRLLLHFGAVDQSCTVFINGQKAGFHEGGFLPFHFDITEYIDKTCQTFELIVKVTDETDTFYHSRGRQKLEHGGLWHAPQSGIWQTVWLESVPEQYVTNVKITPLYDEGAVDFLIDANGETPLAGEVLIYARSTLAAKGNFESGKPFRLPLSGALSWYPARPFLYTVKITAGEDKIDSYLGMRKISIAPDENGIPKLMLNNKPFFQKGVLDQGFFPDGMLTPPSDKAMLGDLQFAKECGFNVIRKHGKIEPLRWYYHCDKIGMLVWQDLPNGGEEAKKSLSQLFFMSKRNLPDHAYKRFGRDNPEGRKQFLQEMEQTVALLYNSPCLGAWVLFNKGWGQFDAAGTCERLKKQDPYRLVDHASGWHDQGGGDICSLHFEGVSIELPPQDKQRATVLTAIGGFGYQEEGGRFAPRTPYAEKMCLTAEDYFLQMQTLWEQLSQSQQEGISGFVFTQLADVQDEVTGLLTYDRSVQKITPKQLQALQSTLP